MDNANSPEYLNKVKNTVIENLKRTGFAPSVQMQDVPRDIEGMDDDADAELDDLDEDENKDVRNTQRRWDKHVERDDELSASEDEDENARNGVLRQPGIKRRRNIMDYQNPNAVPDFEPGIDSPAMSGNEGFTATNGARQDSPDPTDADVEMEESGQKQDEPKAESPKGSFQRSTAGAEPAGPTDVEMEEAEDEVSMAKEEGKVERTEHDTNAEAATEFASNT